jgi:hypothetical protein
VHPVQLGRKVPRGRKDFLVPMARTAATALMVQLGRKVRPDHKDFLVPMARTAATALMVPLGLKAQRAQRDVPVQPDRRAFAASRVKAPRDRQGRQGLWVPPGQRATPD